MDTNDGKEKVTDQRYLAMNAFCHTKARIIWLIILCISSLITGALISSFEDAFLAIPILISFVPMLMGTGGICGSQVATIVIKDLATGHISIKDYLRIITKESVVAIFSGIILGVLNFFVVWWRSKDILISLVVVITLIFVIFVADILGGVLPLALKKAKLNPALMTSPVVTSLIDCVSVVIYFLIAKIVLKL